MWSLPASPGAGREFSSTRLDLTLDNGSPAWSKTPMTTTPAAVSAAPKSLPALRAEFFALHARAQKYALDITRAEFVAEVRKLAESLDKGIHWTPKLWIGWAESYVEELRIGWCDGEDDLRRNPRERD